ncbi:MAG: baseplate assembly protein [Alphaproteobacteria bacterium]|nr:baseplate assembly protein [Alphaproteobacteria bacterium]
MSGISADGGMLEGWPHVAQSIAKCLTTLIGDRVMRRDYCSNLPDLIDAPMNAQNVMALFGLAAIALEPRLVGGYWYGVPQFRLTQVEVVRVSATGEIALVCSGDYLPNGHKGDSKVTNQVTTDVIFGVA